MAHLLRSPRKCVKRFRNAGTPTKFTPTKKSLKFGKTTTVSHLSDRLQDLFCFEIGTCMTRDEILGILDDKNITIRTLGRAIVQAFSGEVTKHTDKSVGSSSTSYHNITLKQVTPRPTQPPIFNEPFFDPAVQLNISIEGEEIDVCGVSASSSEGVSSGLSASTVSSPQAYSESPPLEYPDSPTPLAYPLSSSASSSSSPLYFSQDQDLPLSPRRTPTPAASPTKTQPEKRDQETPFTVKEMNMTLTETLLLRDVRQIAGNEDSLVHHLRTLIGEPALHDIALGIIKNKVQSETRQYASTATKMPRIKRTTGQDAYDFSYALLGEDLTMECPTITEIFKAICKRGNDSQDSLTPPITNAIATALSVYSQTMSITRLINSLFLCDGGAKASCYERLANLSLTYTYKTVLQKVDQLAEQHQNKIGDWREAGHRYCLVVDNVDKMLKSRQGGKTAMKNMVQIIALKDRVVSSPLRRFTPVFRMEAITAEHLIPTEFELALVKNDLMDIVLEIWSEHLPALKSVHKRSVFMDHKHHKELGMKSEMVNLGVLLKSENDIGDIQDILQACHKHVPRNEDDSLSPIPVCGDYKTFQVIKSGQEARGDVKTPEGRYEGLIPVLSEFHISMELLKIIFHLTYDTGSSADVGTLFHARNYIGMTGVTAEPHRKYYLASELTDKTVKALVVKAGMDLFGMATLDDGLPETALAARNMKGVMASFRRNHIVLDVPNTANTDGVCCDLCPKKFPKLRMLRDHYARAHKTAAQRTNGKSDNAKNYCDMLMTLGLMRLYHEKAVAHGDGTRLIMLHKFLFVLCHSLKLTNYSCGLLETVYQILVLPRYLAESIVWNRTANDKGVQGRNMANDLKLEHENGYFKKELTSYRGDFSQANVNRVSIGRAARQEVTARLGKEIGHKKHSGKHTDKKDNHIELLVKKLCDTETEEGVNALQYQGARCFTGTKCMVPRGLTNTVPYSDLKVWINGKLKDLRTKHIYKQFDK